MAELRDCCALGIIHLVQRLESGRVGGILNAREGKKQAQNSGNHLKMRAIGRKVAMPVAISTWNFTSFLNGFESQTNVESVRCLGDRSVCSFRDRMKEMLREQQRNRARYMTRETSYPSISEWDSTFCPLKPHWESNSQSSRVDRFSRGAKTA
jgi:hypothetical protein